MRTLRQEICSVATVIALPVALVAIFPHESLSPRTFAASVDHQPFAAFVTLSPEAEAVALRNAKTAWQADVSADHRMRTYLPLGDLPPPRANGPALPGVSAGGLRPNDAVLSYETPVWQPTAAAEAPVRIPQEKATIVPPVFSREELLELTEREKAR